MAKKAKATLSELLLNLLKKIQIEIDEAIEEISEIVEAGDATEEEAASSARTAAGKGGKGKAKAAEPEPEEEEFNLDDLSDEDIDDLAEAMGVAGKTTAAKRKALAKLDQEDVEAAFNELGEGDGDSEDDDSDDKGDLPDVVVADLTDEEVTAIAEHLKLKKARSSVASLRKALEAVDQSDLNEAFDEVYPEDGDGDDADDDGEEEVTLEKLQELSAKLLKAGERRTVRAILDEFKLKSLGNAKEADYADLYEAFSEAVAELE